MIFVLRVLIGLNMEVAGLKELIRAEIEETDDPNIIFRGNTLCTKAMDHYLKIVGSTYLKRSLTPFVQTILKTKESCEIDPTKVNQSELKKNFKRLMNFVAIAWDSIRLSSEICPREFAEIFSFSYETAKLKFPGNENFAISAVNSFLFLRFFVPAILNPKLFGLCKDFSEAVPKRTFTLVAKVIMNLANLNEVVKKENFMNDVSCNVFIGNNIQSMKYFVTQVCIKENKTPAPNRPNVDLRQEAESLFQFFNRSVEQLSGYSNVKHSSIKNLVNVLAEIDQMHQSMNATSKQVSNIPESINVYGNVKPSEPRDSSGSRAFGRKSNERSRSRGRKQFYENNTMSGSTENLEDTLKNIVNTSLSLDWKKEAEPEESSISEYFSTELSLSGSVNIGAASRRLGETRDASENFGIREDTDSIDSGRNSEDGSRSSLTGRTGTKKTSKPSIGGIFRAFTKNEFAEGTNLDGENNGRLSLSRQRSISISSPQKSIDSVLNAETPKNQRAYFDLIPEVSPTLPPQTSGSKFANGVFTSISKRASVDALVVKTFNTSDSQDNENSRAISPLQSPVPSNNLPPRTFSKSPFRQKGTNVKPEIRPSDINLDQNDQSD
ncbi:hypothetical protein HK096_010871 [Nowakowskiella sp. JEL0078]|nr:hypothetical protein HK096_010871 [Nowakowskiella sp. JEL0078]